ncbi:MAG: hypothetical protein KatS3mg059_0911 [Thermomicrobiales bacterium]|nr:MAG: hypothetical protein KatS3mg059_0911 [Thermomicrobiales bacterium]
MPASLALQGSTPSFRGVAGESPIAVRTSYGNYTP